MKTLYLLRHAKAESGSMDKSDIGRALSAQGFAACTRVGQRMKRGAYGVDAAFVSPATRTQETFSHVAESAGLSLMPTVVKKLYLASAEEMLAVVQSKAGEAGRVLLLAHNPGMHHLALLLAKPGGNPDFAMLAQHYPTAALTVLDFPVTSWQEISGHTGQLREFFLA